MYTLNRARRECCWRSREGRSIAFVKCANVYTKRLQPYTKHQVIGNGRVKVTCMRQVLLTLVLHLLVGFDL